MFVERFRPRHLCAHETEWTINNANPTKDLTYTTNHNCGLIINLLRPERETAVQVSCLRARRTSLSGALRTHPLPPGTRLLSAADAVIVRSSFFYDV